MSRCGTERERVQEPPKNGGLPKVRFCGSWIGETTRQGSTLAWKGAMPKVSAFGRALNAGFYPHFDPGSSIGESRREKTRAGGETLQGLHGFFAQIKGIQGLR